MVSICPFPANLGTTKKHSQRHNGPEGWVLVTRVTSLGHITSSQTNLYKISSSYSRPSSNLKKSTKYQHQLNFKILTKLSFRISTKNNLHNLNQGSAAKYWLNFSFKISPELQLQNLDQTLCSKSGQKFDFMTKLQLPNLHQTIVNTFLSINISYSNNRVTSIKLTKQEWVRSIANARTRVR